MTENRSHGFNIRFYWNYLNYRKVLLHFNSKPMRKTRKALDRNLQVVQMVKKRP